MKLFTFNEKLAYFLKEYKGLRVVENKDGSALVGLVFNPKAYTLNLIFEEKHDNDT